MDTRFLESFVAVVEQGSLAEAARRLNLTSAAVAQRIGALESEIGVHLLFRSGRTVRPTQSGAAIRVHARVFLGHIRDLKSIAVNDTPSGELRLGAVESAKAGWLPNILSGMARKYPEIEIHIVGGTPAPLYAKVVSGELDAANVEIHNEKALTLPPEATDQAEAGATIYIRVPVSLKTKVDEAAGTAGVPINAWALRCFEACLARLPPQPPRSQTKARDTAGLFCWPRWDRFPYALPGNATTLPSPSPVSQLA